MMHSDYMFFWLGTRQAEENPCIYRGMETFSNCYAMGEAPFEAILNF